MTTDNMRFWNKVANVPKEHLKSFSKAGGFRGTDIKPQWRFMVMTETFGPCGHGWGMTEPKFQVEAGHVYCTVGVWTRTEDGAHGQPVWGVGGETLSGRGDDEAFKKSYTDALGNALVKIGVASDIYMGWFDGSKYVKKTEDPDAGEAEEGVREPKTAYRARQDGTDKVFQELMRGLTLIEETGSMMDLLSYWKANQAKIAEMPEGWKAELTAKKDLLKKAFETGLLAPLDGVPPQGEY